MNKKQVLGHAAAAVTSIIWGSTFISTKLLMQSFTPMEILLFRFLLGFAGLCIISPGKLKVKERKHELLFLAAGVVGIHLFYLAENVALLYTATSNVSVIVSAAPFFTAILSYYFLKEKKRKTCFYIGCMIALSGVTLLSFGTEGQSSTHILGDLLSLAAAFLWACYSVLSKKIAQLGYDEIKTTKKIFLYGIISMLPMLFFMDFKWEPARFFHQSIIIQFAYLGFAASSLCFILWNQAIDRLGTIKSSVYIYLIPVITVLLSVTLLQDKMSVNAAAGIILIIAGLFLSEKK